MGVCGEEGEKNGRDVGTVASGLHTGNGTVSGAVDLGRVCEIRKGPTRGESYRTNRHGRGRLGTCVRSGRAMEAGGAGTASQAARTEQEKRRRSA